MDGFNAISETVEVEGRPADPVARRSKGISPGVFAALGVPLVAGRDYSWADLYDYRPVVIVSEGMARDLWGEPAAALGKRLRATGESQPWREIIGVVGDVREDGLRDPVPQTVYWPVLTRRGSPARVTSGAPCASPSAAAALVPTSYFASCGPRCGPWIRTFRSPGYARSRISTS